MTLRTRTRRPRSISKEERPTRSLSNFPRLKPMRFSFHLIFLGSKIRLQDQVVRKIKYFQPAPPHHLVFPACPTSSRSVSPFLSTSPLWSSTSPALCTLLPRIFPWSPITWMLEALSRDQNSISSILSDSKHSGSNPAAPSPVFEERFQLVAAVGLHQEQLQEHHRLVALQTSRHTPDSSQEAGIPTS